jgi:hypothetical protein
LYGLSASKTPHRSDSLVLLSSVTNLNVFQLTFSIFTQTFPLSKSTFLQSLLANEIVPMLVVQAKRNIAIRSFFMMKR